MQKSLPSRESITADTPLRLSVAAVLAYPDGSMTASGLRREANRGRLAIERTAGKDYTTLANINRMRELCRVEREAPGSGSAAHDATKTAAGAGRPGSSSMGPPYRHRMRCDGSCSSGRKTRRLHRVEVPTKPQRTRHRIDRRCRRAFGL